MLACFECSSICFHDFLGVALFAVTILAAIAAMRRYDHANTD